jgi:hypothetical protein
VFNNAAVAAGQGRKPVEAEESGVAVLAVLTE